MCLRSFYGLFILIIILGCTYKEKIAKEILVVAHRADWKNAPENSLKGIENCIEMGVDMVEFDLAMTKDSVLVLMHDKTLERTTNGTGLVIEWTIDSLKQLNLKDARGKLTQYSVPTFEEAMTLCNDKIMVFVDKGYELISIAYPVLKRTGTIEQAHFLGFKSGAEYTINYPEFYQKINYMPLLKPLDSIDKYVESFDNVKSRFYLFSFKAEDKALMNVISKLKEGEYAMATTQVDHFCAGHTDSVSLKNPSMGWGWLINNGFNAICTDRPKELLDYLRKKGLHE